MAGPGSGPVHSVHMKPTEFNGVFGRRTHGHGHGPGQSSWCGGWCCNTMHHKPAYVPVALGILSGFTDSADRLLLSSACNSVTPAIRLTVYSVTRGRANEDRLAPEGLALLQLVCCDASINHGKRQIWSCSERGGRASVRSTTPAQPRPRPQPTAHSQAQHRRTPI